MIFGAIFLQRNKGGNRAPPNENGLGFVNILRRYLITFDIFHDRSIMISWISPFFWYVVQYIRYDVVVVTLTRIIKSVVTGQAPVTLERYNVMY